MSIRKLSQKKKSKFARQADKQAENKTQSLQKLVVTSDSHAKSQIMKFARVHIS